MIGRPHKKINIDVAFHPDLTEKFVGILLEKREVNVAGIGTFKVVPVKSRYLYHNRGKKNIRTQRSVKIKFTPFEGLKNVCKALI